MRLPLKVHAVKIRYRERVLRKMVHGRIATMGGKRYVYITYVPDDDSVTKHRQLRYCVDSPKGREFAPKVAKYIKVKADFDKLLLDWRELYRIEPPEVRFPICSNWDPHHMDNQFYKDAVAASNELSAQHPVYSGGDVLKSKNEQFGKDRLVELGIPYKYEPALDIKSPDGIVPDFLISFYEIDRCVYAEIGGMSEKYDYSRSIAEKIQFYSANFYRHGREMIYCFMFDKYNFDEDVFAAQVLAAYDVLIPEDALDWKNCRPPQIEEDRTSGDKQESGEQTDSIDAGKSKTSGAA